MINFVSNIHYPQRLNSFHKEKTNLCGQNPVNFTSKNLLTKSDKEINKLIRSSVCNEKNFIGSGGEGIVYKIPRTNYCIKIPRTTGLTVPEQKELNLANPGMHDCWSFNITPKDKVNHVLAKSQDGKTIMKFIKGERLGKVIKQKEIYDLPDSSYIDFLKQIETAKKQGRGFDRAPQNIIFNKEKNSLTIIDFYDTNNEIWEKVHKQLTLKDAFVALRSNGFSEEHKANNRKLGGKLLNIVIDELSQKPKTDFEIKENDATLLIEQIMFTQNYDINMKKYDKLKNSLYTMMDLHENFSQNKAKLEKMAKLSKKIIREELMS